MTLPLTAPSTERGRVSRERILAAAADLFALHGYAAVTMREIGTAAGLDSSSLYKHFSGKQELAEAVLDRAAADLLGALEPLGEPGAPRAEQLIDACLELSHRLAQRPTLARLLLAWLTSVPGTKSGFQVSVGPADAHRPSWRALQLVLDWLGRAGRAGVIRAFDPVESCVAFLGMILLRPATQGSLLSSIERERSAESLQAVRDPMLEAALRGALVPQGRDG